jgi:hypothetical protein
VRVVRCPHPRDSQVGDPDIAIVIKKKVLWFDVSVDNPTAMHVFKPHDDTGNEELRLLLSESLTLILMKSKVTPCHKVSDKEDVHVVGERVKHVDQEPKTVKGSLERSSTYGCLSWDRSLRSFMTELTDFLFTIRTLDISFIAYIVLNFLRSTFQT